MQNVFLCITITTRDEGKELKLKNVSPKRCSFLSTVHPFNLLPRITFFINRRLNHLHLSFFQSDKAIEERVQYNNFTNIKELRANRWVNFGQWGRKVVEGKDCGGMIYRKLSSSLWGYRKCNLLLLSLLLYSLENLICATRSHMISCWTW